MWLPPTRGRVRRLVGGTLPRTPGWSRSRRASRPHRLYHDRERERRNRAVPRTDATVCGEFERGSRRSRVVGSDVGSRVPHSTREIAAVVVSTTPKTRVHGSSVGLRLPNHRPLRTLRPTASRSVQRPSSATNASRTAPPSTFVVTLIIYSAVSGSKIRVSVPTPACVPERPGHCPGSAAQPRLASARSSFPGATETSAVDDQYRRNDSWARRTGAQRFFISSERPRLVMYKRRGVLSRSTAVVQPKAAYRLQFEARVALPTLRVPCRRRVAIERSAAAAAPIVSCERDRFRRDALTQKVSPASRVDNTRADLRTSGLNGSPCRGSGQPKRCRPGRGSP